MWLVYWDLVYVVIIYFKYWDQAMMWTWVLKSVISSVRFWTVLKCRDGRDARGHGLWLWPQLCESSLNVPTAASQYFYILAVRKYLLQIQIQIQSFIKVILKGFFLHSNIFAWRMGHKICDRRDFWMNISFTGYKLYSYTTNVIQTSN